MEMDALPLSLRELLEDFAGVSNVPQAIATILFPGVRVTGDPRSGPFRIEAEARGEAARLFHLPLFTVELVGIVIERGPAPDSRTGVRLRVAGSIHSKRAVDVTFELTPEGAWSASGFPPAFVPLPTIEIPGCHDPIELGELLLSADHLTLSLDGEIALSIDLGLGLPPQLNQIFSPAFCILGASDIFETYDPERPEPNLAVRVTARANDIDVELLASPLKPLKLTRTADGSLASDIKLGDYGDISFRMPVFRIDWMEKCLIAEGRFSHRNLRLPLAPVIELLKAGGLDELAEKLPNSIPVAKVGLDDVLSALHGLLKDTLGHGVFQAFALGELSDFIERADQLPNGLREALSSIEVPSDFAFRIAVAADLSSRVSVAAAPPAKESIAKPTAKPNAESTAKSTAKSTAIPNTSHSRENPDITDRTRPTPLKLLIPILGPRGPEILRVTLYSLAFGELLAGQIVTLEIDAEIDRFELSPLALALSGAGILPPPGEPTLRIGCRDLVSIIACPCGQPLPIPVFFKELSLVSTTLDGLHIESRWELPAPPLSFPRLARALASLSPLLLHPDAAPGAIDLPKAIQLALTAGPNFVRFPAYIGGQVLGFQYKNKNPATDALPDVLRALAAIQKLDWKTLLASIPDDLGAKEIDIEIGPGFGRACRILAAAASAPRDLAAWSRLIQEGLAAAPPNTGDRLRVRLVDISEKGLRLAASGPGAEGAIEIELPFGDLLGALGALTSLGALASPTSSARVDAP